MVSKTQDPSLIASFALEWEHNEQVLPALVRYSLAHMLMLLEVGAVPRDKCRLLLEGLRGLVDATLDDVPFDASLDGLQPSLERVLTRRLGPETAGWLGAGRSRQECELVARQLVNRDELLGLIGDVLDLRTALAELARKHADALMPYHTWAQHAEPVTLGYWLAALAEGLCADGDRLEAAFKAIGAARASCGQIVPPPWPIDRLRVARWLGFSHLAENSLYAYSSLDAELQVLSALASLTNHLARMGVSLHLWASDEFGFVSFTDEMSGTSYAMPQKRNPYALRQLRPMASLVHGAWADVAQLHGAGVPLIGDGLIHAGNRLLACLPKVRLCVQLLVRALPGLRVDRNRMAAGCVDDWIVASQLVYGLVGPQRMSFREAHALLHHLVLAMQARGQGPSELLPEDLLQAAREAGLASSLMECIHLQAHELQAMLDPASGLQHRTSGGPAESSVREMLRKLEVRMQHHRQRYAEAKASIAAGARAMDEALRNVLQNI